MLLHFTKIASSSKTLEIGNFSLRPIFPPINTTISLVALIYLHQRDKNAFVLTETGKWGTGFKLRASDSPKHTFLHRSTRSSYIEIYFHNTQKCSAFVKAGETSS